MKAPLLVLAALALSGCGVFNHVTCAPRYMVEACLQEAYAASSTGLGLHCTELNNWANGHQWAGGGSGKPPSKPGEKEPY